MGELKEGNRVVLCDLGNVLLFFSHDLMFRQIANVLCCDVALVENYLRTNGKLQLLESGTLSEDDFLKDLKNACAAPAGIGARKNDFDWEIRRAMSDIFTPNQPMIDALLSLKDRGVKVLLVSNTSSIHFDFVKARYSWIDLFDALVLSYEVKQMKPDEAYYRAAIKSAGAQAEQCLFIDDVQANIEGASKAGFNTHLYKIHDEFLDGLNKFFCP